MAYPILNTNTRYTR